MLHPADEMKIADLQKIVESKDVKVDVMKLYPNVPIIGQVSFLSFFLPLP